MTHTWSATNVVSSTAVPPSLFAVSLKFSAVLLDSKGHRFGHAISGKTNATAGAEFVSVDVDLIFRGGNSCGAV
ncbi:unnamed protein product [Linum trigynum]|uniref:Uncharacterized protein n=1 Tax=Linum trigynum TaxID=586398 RepID=A0AAV2CD93_9ROSI